MTKNSYDDIAEVGQLVSVLATHVAMLAGISIAYHLRADSIESIGGADLVVLGAIAIIIVRLSERDHSLPDILNTPSPAPASLKKHPDEKGPEEPRLAA